MSWKTIRHGLLPSGSGATPNSDAPQNNVAQPNEPLPMQRRPGTLLGSLLARNKGNSEVADPSVGTVLREKARRIARPYGVTVSSPLGSTQTIKPAPAEPQLRLNRGHLRTPSAPGGQKLVDKQRRENAQSLFDDIGDVAASAPDILSDPFEATAYIEQLFNGNSSAAHLDAFDFAQQIRAAFAHAGQTEAPYLNPILMANALAEVSNGDVQRARDVFGALQGKIAVADDALEHDRFALQCQLALDPTSFDALLEIAPHTMMGCSVYRSKTEEKVHRDAHIYTLRAAHELLQAWPAGFPPPRNLEELLATAKRALPPDEGHWSWFEPALDERLRDALMAHPFAVRALICGRELMADPAADPPSSMRGGYFAFRNNIDEADLPIIQSRTFRIVTAAQKNVRREETQSRMKAFVQEFKDAVAPGPNAEDSPFAAFALGTGGVFLDHPEKDFGQAHAIDVVVQALNEFVVAEPARKPGESPDPAIVEAAIGAAVCRHWKERLANTGRWRDDMPIGRKERKQIIRDVAASLNLDRKYLLSHRRLCKVPKVINAVRLRELAENIGADMDAVIVQGHRSHATDGPAPSTLGQCLTRMVQMHERNYLPPEKPQGNFEVLDEVVEHIPPTWEYSGGAERVNGGGTPFTANSGSNFGTPALPVGAAAWPDVTVANGHGIAIGIGSTAHTGHLKLVMKERRVRSGGVGAYAGLQAGVAVASVHGGVSVGSEKVDERGVVFRARLANYDDPVNTTAWRKTLKHLIHVMSTSGPNGALPRTQDELWNAIADALYKDPCLSVNWIERDGSTKVGSASVSGGLRASTPDGSYKAGTFLTLGGNKSSTREKRRDKAGSLTVATNLRDKGRSVTATAAAVAAGPAINANLGPVASTSVPSVPMVSVSATAFKKSTTAVLRTYYEDGLIVGDKTFLDVQFPRMKDFLAYVDNNNDRWRRAYGGNQRELNTFTTRVKLAHRSGNQVFGERLSLSPDAVVKINKKLSLVRSLENRQRPLTDTERQALDNAKAEVAAMLEDAENNFEPLLLYGYEENGIQRTRGFNFLVRRTKTNIMTGERELTFKRAHNPVKATV